MSLRIIEGLVQGTDEWHDARRGMITASVVGQLVTSRMKGPLEYACPACEAPANDPCRSKVKRAGEPGAPIKTTHPERGAVAAANRGDDALVIEAVEADRALIALLTAERITGHTDPTYVSDDMMRGWMDEEAARAMYAEHYAEVTEVGLMVRALDGGPEVGFSPDGLVGDDGLIEIKSRRQKKHLLTVVADAVPAENIAQIQCGLFVSGRAWCDYISYSGGMAFWVKRVLPDPRWFAAIESAVRHFERAAEALASDYLTRVQGLPVTERSTDMEITFS